jgi:hypothetical protein
MFGNFKCDVWRLKSKYAIPYLSEYGALEKSELRNQVTQVSMIILKVKNEIS